MSTATKIALVTGGSRGLGKDMALSIAKKGIDVIITYRSKEAEALQVVSEIESLGQKAIALHLDMSMFTSLNDFVNTVKTTLQVKWNTASFDFLINNAGMGATTEATELDPEEVARLIGVNVIGAVNSVAAVLPEMAKRGSGQLVAVSSLSAYRGLRKSAAYCASKASLSSFFESLRIDLIGSGVNVTIIHPGFIKTPLTAGRKADMPYLMELDYAVNKIIGAIEKKKKSYAFPWQLATIVRAGMIMPNFMYDWIARRNSFRE